LLAGRKRREDKTAVTGSEIQSNLIAQRSFAWAFGIQRRKRSFYA
jgi:hypothetical protein